MSEINDIAKRIKNIRNKKGWKQGKLADEADLGIGTIARIETSVYEPSVSSILKIAAALGVTANDLLYETPPANKNQPQNNQKKIGDLTVDELISVIDQSAAKKNESAPLSKEELEIIRLLRNDPSFTSDIIQLLTPDEDLAPVAPPIPMSNKTVSVPKARARKAK